MQFNNILFILVTKKKTVFGTEMQKFMGNEVEDQQESNFFCSWDEATLTAKLPAPEQCPHEVIRLSFYIILFFTERVI